jgi:hypothetical protein
MLKSSDTKMLEDIQRLFMNTGRPNWTPGGGTWLNTRTDQVRLGLFPIKFLVRGHFKKPRRLIPVHACHAWKKVVGDKILYRIRTYYQRFSRHGL